MTSYNQMMADFLASGPDYVADLPENWKQGRTAFGGITTALLAAAIGNDHPDLPPLRTIQVNFVGPAVDRLSVRHEMLRQGKNNVTFRAELDSELGAGTHGYLTYGVNRTMQNELDYPRLDIPVQPEDAEPYHTDLKGAPSFISNMDRRHISGPRFLDGSDNPDILMWGRLADPESRDKGLLPLLVLADLPPAALTAVREPIRAVSSTNWSLSLLTDDLTTRDGWWLMRSATRFIKDGYSSQLIQVWNSDGRRVMDAMQMQAIFT